VPAEPATSSAVVSFGDQTFRRSLEAATILLLEILGALIIVLIDASTPSLRAFGPSFLFGRDWDPAHDRYGALPFVVGTIISSLLGLAIAVPVAIGTAIFIAEIAPPNAGRVLALLVDLLAAIPSVIYGLWGIFFMVPWIRDVAQPVLSGTLGRLPLVGGIFRGPQIGVSLLASGIMLGIVVLPYIAAIARETILQVPRTYREAALALGATRWESIRLAVMPAARSGFIGSIFLGLGRALGETMAVTMVIGNRAEVPSSLFDPSHTIASSIANEFAEATGDLHLSALGELALILLLVTLLVNALARLLVGWSLGKTGGGKRAE
jgi:phosphate transport system permease protein